jgi:hypothetical protein
MLEGILPRLLPENITVQYIVFQGKHDLEKNIEKKLKNWLLPDTGFLVMRDQDAQDCSEVKSGLVEKVKRAGKSGQTCVRIACRELESFYLGDLFAVEQGLERKGLARKQDQERFRTPDIIHKPSTELDRLTSGTYRKIAGSRGIGRHLDIEGANTSHSFNVLLKGIRKLTSGEPAL